MHELINIKSIKENYFYTKDKIIQIIKIKPINFYLMSLLEQKALLKNFKFVLLNINYSFQIQIKIIKLDQSNTFKYLNEARNKDLDNFNEEITENYINFLKKLEQEENLNTQEYYLINSVKYEKYNFHEKLMKLNLITNKISQEFKNIGNDNKVLNKIEITNLLNDYFE